ncbi:MAG: TlpA family protein disulfide reductase [Actinomycetia bacterium]|nr:TlpA family protein disulfide reductase [Actinomycetes bacterium]
MSGKQQTRQQHRNPQQPAGRTRGMVVVGGVLALAVIAVLSLVLFDQGDDSSAAVASGNEAAPEVVLEGFDGTAVAISSLRGGPAVVNFWASWCFPCLAELPGFENVYQAHGDSVQFLGINLSDDPASAQSVVEDTGITYPLARDPRGEAFTAFGGLGMPTTVFLDEEGRVVELYTGELTARELEAKIIEYFES